MMPASLVVLVVLAGGIAVAQSTEMAPDTLPATAAAQLMRSLDAARPHARHLWRDTSPSNADGTVNAYIEIARGDRRKWELDMGGNARAIDRVIPERVGGYPVNYGFVPQTVSYDGDPFDALMLGPPLAGGTTVRGVVVGVMYMEDEKGLVFEGARLGVDCRRHGVRRQDSRLLSEMSALGSALQHREMIAR
jgi:hypothetical protein